VTTTLRTDTLRVVLKNATSGSLTFNIPAPGILVFEIGGRGSTWGPVRQPHLGNLKPGEEVLLTDSSPDLKDCLSGASVRIRVRLEVSVAAKEENGRRPHLYSNWVTVPVEAGDW